MRVLRPLAELLFYISLTASFTISIPISSNSGAGPIRLDIQPIAWKGGAGATGDVTFIYKRSSSGN